MQEKWNPKILLNNFLEAKHMSMQQMQILQELVETLTISDENLNYKINLAIIISAYIWEILRTIREDTKIINWIKTLPINDDEYNCVIELSQSISHLINILFGNDEEYVREPDWSSIWWNGLLN